MDGNAVQIVTQSTALWRCWKEITGPACDQLVMDSTTVISPHEIWASVQDAGFGRAAERLYFGWAGGVHALLGRAWSRRHHSLLLPGQLLPLERRGNR